MDARSFCNSPEPGVLPLGLPDCPGFQPLRFTSLMGSPLFEIAICLQVDKLKGCINQSIGNLPEKLSTASPLYIGRGGFRRRTSPKTAKTENFGASDCP